MGAIVGPFAVNYFAETFGRRETAIFSNNVFLIITGCTMWLAVHLNTLELLIFARFMVGATRMFRFVVGCCGRVYHCVL